MRLSLTSRPVPAFPNVPAGRLPHSRFRGLLSVHSRCSPHGRWIAQGDPFHRSASNDVVTSIIRSDCYRLERQFAGRDSHPLRDGAFPRHTVRNQEPVYASMAPDRSMVVVHRLVRALRLCMRCLPGFPARFGVIGIATPKTLLPFSIPPHLRPLPSADVTRRLQYYGPLRHPDRPGLSLAGFRLVRATPPTGLPVLPPSPSSMRAAATTPVEPAGARVARFPRG